MKKIFKIFSFGLVCMFYASLFVGCGGNDCNNNLKLEAYNDTAKGYAINNTGVTLECVGDNTYNLGGDIEEASQNVLSAFGFKDSEKHIVSIKLETDKTVNADNFSISVAGPTKTNTYDKSALDGENFTYLLLSVDEMTENKGYKISVKWNQSDKEETYIINRANNFNLK